MSISPDRILHEDDHLLAVNKLSGELVVKGSGRTDKLPLLDFLRKDYPGLRPLHRIDFETSGVLLFARTKQAADAVRTFGPDDWTKTYVALVAGRIGRPDGVIRAPLPARSDEAPLPAETQYKVLERFGNSSLVEARIKTGRQHQIRRHFAAIDHPLALDDVHGNVKFNRTFTREFRYRRFFLHAARVSIRHPVTGEKLLIEAPMPRKFLDVLDSLRSLEKGKS